MDDGLNVKQITSEMDAKFVVRFVDLIIEIKKLVVVLKSLIVSVVFLYNEACEKLEGCDKKLTICFGGGGPYWSIPIIQQ
jgi:hypothetical protein